MNQHYSEADLLETYYTQPGQSMPVMMHLADCTDCAARYERLERKVRSLAACHDDKPETFWTRQRMLIARRIAGRPSHVARVTRVAAAAALVVALGGVATWKQLDTPAPLPVALAAATAATAATAELTVPADPWESEQLDEFQSLVAWESWDETKTKNGDHS
jgi:anti-sigma factor RsiW